MICSPQVQKILEITHQYLRNMLQFSKIIIFKKKVSKIKIIYLAYFWGSIRNMYMLFDALIISYHYK